MRIRDHFKNPIVTYATIGGIDYDSVTVVADYQPFERDTGVGEYVEVCSVSIAGLDMTDSILVSELEELEERLLIEAQDLKSFPHINQARRYA